MERARGHTLAELMVVLVIVGVLAAVAAPTLHAWVSRMRTRRALDTFATDMAYARMTAVRTGRGAVLRFERTPDCAHVGPRGGGHAYVVAMRGVSGESAGRRTDLRLAGGPVCVAMNGATDSITFNSRGLLIPFNNRTVWSVDGRARDSLTVSVLGRVLRRY